MAASLEESPGEQVPLSASMQPAKMQPYVIYLVGILMVMNILNCMDRIAMAVLMPQIKAELHLTDAQLGLLVGLAFSLFYAGCGLPIARYADRGNRVKVMTASLVVWSLMTAACGAAQNFWHLLLARMGLGAGEAGAMPASSSIITQLVPYDRRSSVFAITTFGGVLGGGLGIALAGWLGPLIGWRWTFVALGAPGLLMAVLVKFSLREPPANVVQQEAEPAPISLKADLGTLWNCRSYRRIVIFLVSAGFISGSHQQWFASFYSRSHGLTSHEIGTWLALASGLGAVVGLFGGGWITDRAARRDIRLPYVIGGSALMLSFPLAVGVLFAPTAQLSLILLGFASVLTTIPMGAAQTTLYSTMPLRLRSMGGATLVFLTGVLGLGLGPLCIGIVSDYLAPQFGNHSLRYALVLPLVVYPVYVWSFFATRVNLAEDLAAAASGHADLSVPGVGPQSGPETGQGAAKPAYA